MTADQQILDILKTFGRLTIPYIRRAGYFTTGSSVGAGLILDDYTLWRMIEKNARSKNMSIWELYWKHHGEVEFQLGGARTADQLQVLHYSKTRLAQAYYEERGLQFVKQMSNTDMIYIKRAIERDFYLGERAFARKLQDSYIASPARFRRIKRTESHTALEKGGYNYAVGYGAKYKRQNTVGDSRVRPSHRAAQAEGWIQVDKAFVSTGRMVADDINCRCYLSYRF